MRFTLSTLNRLCKPRIPAPSAGQLKSTMTSYLSRLNPVPGFPQYTGPHRVGTIDVEIPISDLEAPSAAPVDNIPTVQYRIFYPCDPEASGKHITWIPSPQREYISAYTRFIGAGSKLAQFVSYLPHVLNYITIPAHQDAPILTPTTANGRWPVMIFSHGLGGSRNAYSHLVGSIASHGVVVVAPEHRDGSTPISFIRDVPLSEKQLHKHSSKKWRRTVDYVKMAHTQVPEVEESRNAQLKIRLWELGLIHDSLLKVDVGTEVTNLDLSSASLSQFKGLMDVHNPGKITFAGHSFGAATVAQLVKSTFYAPLAAKSATKDFSPLFTPSPSSSISSQITPQTPLILLDAWCLALRATATRWLWNLPFPSYTPGGKGGSSILAIESQAFFKWRVHLKATKQLISPNPSSPTPADYQNGQIAEPNFFYATTSQHLSQSDFGILFPWVGRRFLAIEDPDRILRLNVRAVLQLLRNAGVEVAPTSEQDMELTPSSDVDHQDEKTRDDTLILEKQGEIKGWKWISTDVSDLEDVDVDDAAAREEELDSTADAAPADGDELTRRKSETRL